MKIEEIKAIKMYIGKGSQRTKDSFTPSEFLIYLKILRSETLLAAPAAVSLHFSSLHDCRLTSQGF